MLELCFRRPRLRVLGVPQDVRFLVETYLYGCGDVEMCIRGWSIAEVFVADTVLRLAVFETGILESVLGSVHRTIVNDKGETLGRLLDLISSDSHEVSTSTMVGMPKIVNM
jgi:hypothetical protein